MVLSLKAKFSREGEVRDMSQTEQNAKSETESGKQAEAEKKPSTLVDALFDMGLSWADFGVGQGRRALEQSAKTLEKAAHALSDLQHRLRKDQGSIPTRGPA
jgi:hypothetical protein